MKFERFNITWPGSPPVNPSTCSRIAMRISSAFSTVWRTRGEPARCGRRIAKDPKPPRHWRTRPDPFAVEWPRVVTWLESEPDRTAKELFARLRREQPGTFIDGQVRTLQRRVKEWRTLAARRLVFAEPLADLVITW